MVRISIFGKQGCAKCETTKRKLNHFLAQWQLDHEVALTFHDMDTVDGRAEGAFHDVLNIPVTRIEREGMEVARWDGEVPASDRVREAIQEEAHAPAH